MKQNGTTLNTGESDLSLIGIKELLGDRRTAAFIDTPLRADAFDLDDSEKMIIISHHFREIMKTLGLDLNDDSLKDTPERVAKMYVQELFSGLDPARKPVVTLFDNKYQYNQMLVEKDISLYSNCEHHFVPIIGKAHIAYLPSGKVAGLSKLNRVVQYYAQRPQVQERLTVQIAQELKAVLETDDVAIIIEATHLCVASRGIKDTGSSTITANYSGAFLEKSRKEEFLRHLKM
jgi:GTP cyclohydrolase IA